MYRIDCMYSDCENGLTAKTKRNEKKNIVLHEHEHSNCSNVSTPQQRWSKRWNRTVGKKGKRGKISWNNSQSYRKNFPSLLLSHWIHCMFVESYNQFFFFLLFVLRSKSKIKEVKMERIARTRWGSEGKEKGRKKNERSKGERNLEQITTATATTIETYETINLITF